MAEVFEDENEQTVTIDEYIEGVEAQELEADLVLGGDDGKECTYNNGYMKRQAIFSCLTCVPSGNAGVCTACSLTCHDGHEVVELWTKRNFRCDCGNSKFGEFICKLFAEKEPENSGNSYNQNFKGSYCTCARPYPDPEAKEQVEMIQCCICEDWFHENHLGLESLEEIPRDEEGEPLYEDFICQECAVICSFLTLYPHSIWAPAKQSNASIISTGEEIELGNGPSAGLSVGKLENGVCSSENLKRDGGAIHDGSETQLSDKDGKISSTEELAVGNALLACTSVGKLENGVCSSENLKMDDATVHACAETQLSNKDASLAESSEKNLISEHNDASPSDKVSSSKCTLGMDLCVASLALEKKKPMFLVKNWRGLLCRCDSCVEYYVQKGISHLIDREDSLEEYENLANQKREKKLQEQEGVEQKFLSKLGHVQKIEILSGIADMKNELHSFLESFDTSKPVTSADVHQLFENLAKKRQRTE